MGRLKGRDKWVKRMVKMRVIHQTEEKELRKLGNAVFLDARQLAFGMLASGVEPTKVNECLMWTGHSLPSLILVNKALREIGDHIIAMAAESCQQAIAELKANTTISFDGAWEHRRKSHRCIFSVFSQETRKIIAYRIENTWNGRPEDRVENYAYIPQNLEVIALIHLIDELKDIPEIVAYCHDNDAKTRNVIEGHGWTIKEYLDEGHAMKSFRRELDKANFGAEISSRMLRWVRQLIQTDDLDMDDKFAAWMNTTAHLSGDHEACPFKHGRVQVVIDPDDDDMLERMDAFLEKTWWVIERCSSYFSTQINESFNRGKLKYATKDVKWGFTWDARMACAVLDRNWPHWKMALYDRLELPELPSVVRLGLIAHECARLNLKEFRHSQQYREDRKKQRKIIFENQKKKSDRTRIGYKPNPNKKTNRTPAPGKQSRPDGRRNPSRSATRK
jgi:hypothetical protein